MVATIGGVMLRTVAFLGVGRPGSDGRTMDVIDLPTLVVARLIDAEPMADGRAWAAAQP
jgi:hypothetical protein